jgi:hypothetical protein
MDRKNIIIKRKSIHTFLSTISFNKSHYEVYNNILSRKLGIDNIVIIFLVCQTARQIGFDGYFDEFYIDITKRKNVYLNHILYNLRTAYLSKSSFLSKLNNKFYCSKTNNREMAFNRIIQTFNFGSLLTDLFMEDNEELKEQFITVCNLILAQHQSTTSSPRIVPVD